VQPDAPALEDLEALWVPPETPVLLDPTALQALQEREEIGATQALQAPRDPQAKRVAPAQQVLVVTWVIRATLVWKETPERRVQKVRRVRLATREQPVQPEQPGPWEPKEALDPPALKEILVQPEQLVPKRCVDLRATPATPATPADQEQRELEDQPVVPAIPETLVILEPRARQDPRVIAVSKVYKEKPDCQAPLARLALRAQLVREVIQETPEIQEP
jgi:hypothetical protein